MSAMLPNRQLWAQGPHIVAIGGGTGLSTMLRGLKKYTKNLTAIVTVSDDGGGSGMLRRDIGMLPPGDIRHCMESLANTEPVMQQLLTYRFESGTLRGQCFGNLLLAALNGVTGSFDEAVRSMGQVLAISGTVIPVTTTDVRLTATFENGAYVVGESNIFGFKKQQDCRIDHVELLPAHPKAPRCARRHRGGGPHPPRAGESVYEHHPEPAGGRRGGGHRRVRRAEDLRLQHHDAGR